MFLSTAFAQDNEEVLRLEDSLLLKNKNTVDRGLLVSFTPPVVGYATGKGTILNYVPLTLEIAVHERMGLRIHTQVLYYNSGFQSYAAFLSIPFYLEKSENTRHYWGFYAGPYVALGEYLLPDKKSRVGGGFEVGYSWTYENSMQFSLSLMRNTKGGGGLNLALGKWF